MDDGEECKKWNVAFMPIKRRMKKQKRKRIHAEIIGMVIKLRLTHFINYVQKEKEFLLNISGILIYTLSVQ